MASKPELLAHSSPRSEPDRKPQTYRAHTEGVEGGAMDRATDLYTGEFEHARLLEAYVGTAARFHDLGKLDSGNQLALASGRNQRLPIDHVDAGVAHLVAGCPMAAWLIRAHHAPGLPRKMEELVRVRPLRGARNRSASLPKHLDLIDHVDAQLDELVRDHHSVCNADYFQSDTILHGLPMRIALSCLVDSDHDDTAGYDRGFESADPPATRWQQRVNALDRYVDGLSKDAKGDERSALRNRFYAECRNADQNHSMTTCTGPVGIGKTTAVLAYLLQKAAINRLRRIFVVAPFTNIINQTVDRLREAIVLPGENPNEIVSAHHHQADFSNIHEREFATLWRAPIIVTTAVQFFETLAGNLPGKLRKLNGLPRSAVFLDEAHAAIPVRLWPQNWKWLTELCDNWECHFVFASGSLIKFWEFPKIRGEIESRVLPDIGVDAIDEANELEGQRVRYEHIKNALSRGQLVDQLLSNTEPTLVILNTVQSAAVIATELRAAGKHVLHLSTALCPQRS